MRIWSMIIVLVGLILASCFKKPAINEHALLQERACIESIELNDYKRAQRHCELCLEFNKASPECLNGIGLTALASHDEEKAIVYFSKAIRQNNDFSQARNNLGVIYFSRGDFHKALKYFDRSLAIDPANTDARNNSGLSHLRLAQRFKIQGDAKKSHEHLIKAKEQMTKLLLLEPDYTSAYRDLGVIELALYDLTEFDEKKRELLLASKKSFERCLSIDQTEDGCFEGLGQVFHEEGHYDKAFANYFLCLSYAPDNSNCRAHIVTSFEKSAQAEGGYKAFRNKIGQQPENARAHEAFCIALFERGLDAEARLECERAIKLDNKLCNAHYHLADHFAATLDAEKASHYCRSYLLCDSQDKNKIKQEKCREIIISLRQGHRD